MTGFFYHEIFVKHLEDYPHVESPGRLNAILERIKEGPLAEKLTFIEPAPAEREWLERVHQREYVEGILALEVTDAAIEANYELGRLVMSEPVLRLEGAIESSASYFKRVQQAPPNPYAKLAAAKLARLDAAKTDTKP